MIIPTQPEHVALVAPFVSADGVRELAEIYGMSVEEGLRRNLKSSTAWTMFCGPQVLAIFGIAPVSVMEGTGEFWIVSTTHICAHRIAFARQCRRFLPKMLEGWSEVACVLEHGRKDVLDWAQWLGAKVTPINDRLSRMVLCPLQPE